MAVVENAGVLLPTTGYTPTAGMASSITMYSGRTETLAELYRLQPNLRLVIRFLARNIAQLGLKAFDRIGDSDRRPVDPMSELGQFLRSPTPDVPKPVSRHRWIRGIVSDLALYDNAYLLKWRSPTSGRLNAIRIPPTVISPVTAAGASALWPTSYVIQHADGPRHYAPDEIVHLHGDNPGDPRLGISPVESLRRILAEDESSGEWREQFWNSAAKMSGWIERPAEAARWDPTKRERFTSSWRDNWSGTGGEVGGTPVLEDGMQFHEASFSAKDSEYLGARRLSREECAAAYFIPPVFVGILENANFANMREQHVSLYADTLGPFLDEMTEDFELQLLPEFAHAGPQTYFEFNIAAKLEGSFEEQAAAIQTSTGAPWLTRNEARALRNLSPVPGGDDLVVPLNVLVGGQASPTDSAPSGTLSRRPGMKALPRYARGWEEAHRAQLARYFSDQGELVLGRLAAGMTVAESFPVDDWNVELKALLLGLSQEMTAELGTQVAESFGAEFDETRTLAWLDVNATAAAARINAATYDQIGAAVTGTGARMNYRKLLGDVDGEGLEDPFLDDLQPARNVFAIAAASRATEIATTRVTSVGQWARREGAGQAGARTKTWIASGLQDSRHAALDGETVPLGEPFSNGGDGPGDPVLGVSETAGCQCSLEFSA